MPEVNKSEKHPTELHQRSALQKFIFFAFGMIAACGPLTPGIGRWPCKRNSHKWKQRTRALTGWQEELCHSSKRGGVGPFLQATKKELAPAKKPGILSALVTVAAQNWFFHIENQQAGQSNSLN
jgi:hypothetical protein